MENEDQDNPTGTLGQITDQLGELLDPTTTTEAQGYARKFLDKQLSSPLAGKQNEIMTQMEKESQAAQEVLRAARAKLLARQYNPADRWYSLAAALGAPTRVGGVGELASRTANALNQSRERKQTYEEGQDKEALGYDEKISQLGMDLLKAKEAMALGQGKIDASLAQESLKTLGKRVNPAQTNQNKAQQALDREYAKDYLDWVQNGQATAVKSSGELSQVRDRLRGYKIDEKGEKVPITEGDFLTRQLGPTGRTIGTISTVPLIGKAVQDIIAPGSADIREMVESTVQQSLRPILGAQFTEKEGERLISRVYNPRLRPEVNAARVQRLLDQITTAAKAKTEAAKYYEQHGTLGGFQGKYKFSIDDFMPPPANPLAPHAETSGEVDDHGVPYEGPPNPYRGSDAENNAPAGGGAPFATTSPAGQRLINGKPVVKLKDLPHRGYAKGGSVSGADDTAEMWVELPDGSLVPAAKNATQEDFAGHTGSPDSGDTYDPASSRAALAAIGAGVGYGAGRIGSSLISTGADLKPGNKTTPAQARLLSLMERSNLPPDQITSLQKRFGRMGVPTMPLDFSDDLRAATQTALNYGGAESVDLMDRLKARQAEGRTRTLEQVNKGLKPDDYFDKEAEIKEKLYGNKAKGIESESSPLYKAAETQFPAISSAQLGKLMDTPSGQKAVKAAIKTMKDKGIPIGKVNPVTGAVMKPSLEFLNQVKIEMDNLVGAAKTAGKDAKARDIGNLRTSFRNELDTATTDPATGESPYKTARGTYDARKAQLDALQSGREEFGSMQPQEVQRKVAGLNFEQKDAFRTGVAQSITEMLNNPSTDINAAKRLVGSPAMLAKLQSMFDTPHEFEVFKTALEKEVEMHDNARQLLGKETTVRQRGAAPKPGIIARGAEQAPTLGVFSPLHWALKYVRSKTEMKPEEAAEIINLMKSSTPDEIADFGKKFAGKFGRAAARKKRGSRMGMAGAALGAALGALEGGDEETPPADDAVLAGLSDEDKQAALTPAKAKGGKIEAVKEMIEMLRKQLTDKPAVDVDDLKNQVSHVAMQANMMPADVWAQLTGKSIRPPWEAAPVVSTPTPRVSIPAQPEKLAPYAAGMDAARAKLDAIRQSITNAQTMSPDRARQAHATGMAADETYNRMMSNPSLEDMNRLNELVRNLQSQSEGKRRGGRMRRQFGGMTNHA